MNETTRDATPREALEAQIYDAIDSICGSVETYDVEVGYPDPDGDTEITIPSVEYTAETTANAVIKHLWRSADDPAVVEAMYAASVNGVFGEDADSSLTGREIVQRAFGAGLTALLGPRPQAAAGDDLDADSLVEVVNSVRGLDPRWKLKDIGGPYLQGYVAVFVDTANHRRPDDHSDFLNGTGPTRIAAIKNAVENAKETADETA